MSADLVVTILLSILSALILLVARAIMTTKGMMEKQCKTQGEIKASLKKMEPLVDQLWVIHLGDSAKDEDGAPKWYVRKALGDAISALSENIGALGNILQEMNRGQEDVRREVRDGFQRLKEGKD